VLDGRTLHLNVVVPPNATATVYLPTAETADVTESGKPLAQAPGVLLIGREGGSLVLKIESGSYAFVGAMKPLQEQR